MAENEEVPVLEDPEGNKYMVMSFNYTHMIVPFKAGLQILTAMADAELYDKYEQTITVVNKDTISAVPMSRDEYVKIKMAQLLGTNKQ